MPSVSTKPLPTSSGIATAQNGERHIPSSTRPDGSKRKEIKIRPGYKPPEDVEVYKNKIAEAWKNRDNRGGVPGAEGLDDADNGSGTGAGGGSNNNARRRETRKKAKQDGRQTENEDLKTSELENQPLSQKPVTQRIEELSPDPEAEKARQVRSLRKKLRQARELREKKDKGDNLLPVQIGKIVKISELVRQLEGLGVSEDELDLDQQLASNSTDCSGSDSPEGQEGMEVHVDTTGLGNGVYGWMWCILIPLKGFGDGVMEQARCFDSTASQMRGGRSVAEVSEISV